MICGLLRIENPSFSMCPDIALLITICVKGHKGHKEKKESNEMLTNLVDWIFQYW